MKRGNPGARQVPSRFMTHNPRLERETKKKEEQLNTSLNRSRNSRNSSMELDESLKLQSRPAVRTIKHELKNLDFLQTILYQWAYALGLAQQCYDIQFLKASDQFSDRCQQLVELKKTVMSLSSDIAAREKTKLLDDVLSMEYSSLKAVEDDILMTSAYLQELENASYFTLHKMKLGENVIVSPSELINCLEKASLTLKQIQTLIDPEAQEIKNLGMEIEEFLNVVTEEQKEIERNEQLVAELQRLYDKEKIIIAEMAIEKREIEIDELLSGSLM
ncbi:unnamed protein product [Blepharisma stoltei]|uniref:Uncharacterized protein n=1 Tax=Blepharisma stoltei TaxID=1481888 RepID=A0AAU9JRK6_9CILI|nr:unnamed protein product [Blepharisma stoltei]